MPVADGGWTGWLHRADGAGSRTGVLMVGTVGFEGLCAHRAWRCLGFQFARAGVHALRLTLPGTGDAPEPDGLPDLVPRWLDTIGEAGAWMRRTLDLDEMVPCGLHLGALLVAHAAARAQGWGRLVLLAPPRSGQQYLREQHIRAHLGGFPVTQAAGDVELPALRLHEAAVRDIRALSLAHLPPTAAQHLLLERAGTTDVLAAQRSKATIEPFDGYDALMSDAHLANLPGAAWRRVVAWVGGAASEARQSTRLPLVTPASTRETWIERPVHIPAMPGVTLNGMHTGPVGRAPEELAVVVLGTGAVPQAGYGRSAAYLSRRLAEAGAWSLRFDFTGTGDSGGGSADLADLYSSARAAETSAALDWLCSMGHRRFVLVGTCSGAFQAMRAALADGRVAGVVLANQLFYGTWSGGGLDGWQRRRAARASRAKRSGAPDPWTLPAHGSGPTLKAGWRVLQAGLRMALRVERLRIGAGRVAGFGMLHRRFRALAVRGVRTLVLASEGDAALTLLEEHYGPRGHRLTRAHGMEVIVAPAFDHALGLSAAQGRMADEVERFLARLKAHEFHPGTRE